MFLRFIRTARENKKGEEHRAPIGIGCTGRYWKHRALMCRWDASCWPRAPCRGRPPNPRLTPEHLFCVGTSVSFKSVGAANFSEVPASKDGGPRSQGLPWFHPREGPRAHLWTQSLAANLQVPAGWGNRRRACKAQPACAWGRPWRPPARFQTLGNREGSSITPARVMQAITTRYRWGVRTRTPGGNLKRQTQPVLLPHIHSYDKTDIIKQALLEISNK